jgi:hypothetical protein
MILIGDWALNGEVSAELAETWSRCLQAEIESRGWSGSSIAQLERGETSGSQTIRDNASGRSIAIAWTHKAGGLLSFKVRSTGSPEFTIEELKAFVGSLNKRSENGPAYQFYRFGMLQLPESRPWRGELCLDDHTRLGPPSREYMQALYGPRVVLVDAIVKAFGEHDAIWVFHNSLGELAIFLTLVVGSFFEPSKPGKAWTFEVDSAGNVANCEVRPLGYLETAPRSAMPMKGIARSIPQYRPKRPELASRIPNVMDEIEVPIDISELWKRYRELPADRQRQFLQAAAKWQEGIMHWAERPTLSFALMVVACEALKPANPDFGKHNIYDVVAALIRSRDAPQARLDTCATGPQ